MKTQGRCTAVRGIAICGVAALLTAGCNKKADNTLNFTNAINNYYGAHPVCLWTDPMKFPVQADTSDTSKTSGYDALVDQGLLTRTSGEKKVMIVASKQVNNYDLSDKGRSVWTADTTQPGFGNFCYGHRHVSHIDSATPTNDAVGATTQIAFQYTIIDAPAWATAAETQNAYPQLHADLASGSHTGQATLNNTSSGWETSTVHPSGSSDGSNNIVQ